MKRHEPENYRSHSCPWAEAPGMRAADTVSSVSVCICTLGDVRAVDHLWCMEGEGRAAVSA